MDTIELTKEQNATRVSRIKTWKNKGADIPDNITWDEFYIIFMNEANCKRCGILYPDENWTHHTHKKNLTMDRGIMCMKCNLQTKQPQPKTYIKKIKYPVGIYGTRVR